MCVWVWDFLFFCVIILLLSVVMGWVVLGGIFIMGLYVYFVYFFGGSVSRYVFLFFLLFCVVVVFCICFQFSRGVFWVCLS